MRTVIVAILLAGCEQVLTLTPPPTVQRAVVDASEADASFPEGGIGSGQFVVVAVEPNHGSFLGGTTAVLRGSGFRSSASVRVGGRMVQPADIELLDEHRLQVVVPAGEPGSVDVVVSQAAQTLVLENGYRYDRLAIDPVRGGTAGGTTLRLQSSGATFASSDSIRLAGLLCRDLTVVSPTVATCVTPAGNVGPADVVWVGSHGEERLPAAFEYYEAADPIGGGLGGGPLEGTLEVTVFDSITGTALPGAFAMLGEDPSTRHRGLTNLRGQIAFNGDDIRGPLNLHVSMRCFERASVIGLNARSVTLFLTPILDPVCLAMGGGGGGLPPGTGRFGSHVSGQLIFRNGEEFGPGSWDALPPNQGDWQRVAYVAATQRCVHRSGCGNPDPSIGGMSRVLESPAGDVGYPYRIFVRPSAMAVFAVAGLENRLSGEFRPYLMGVARGLVVGPGEEAEDVHISMSLPLDHIVRVQASGLPPTRLQGPNTFRATAHIDLGGEGYIARDVGLSELDVVRSRSADSPFRFFAQPALAGTLSDGRYRIGVSWLTGVTEGAPETHVVHMGLRDVNEVVSVGNFIAVPELTTPVDSAPLPADRILRWGLTGGSAPSFQLINLTTSDGNPAWQIFVPPDVFAAPIPDLSGLADVDDLVDGELFLSVYAIRIPGRLFNELSYSDLDEARWRAWSHSESRAVR